MNFSDTKSDSEGVHHGVGGDYRPPEEEELSVYKVLWITESEKAHLAGVGVNCLNE